MKITLIHPSRGRALKAKDTLAFWLAMSSKQIEIEHILSIDHSDDELQKELYMMNFKDSLIVISDNTDVVQATNKAARMATGDVLVYFSDDFKCEKDWDLDLYKALILHVLEPRLLKVDDCLQPFHVAILTIPIMTRELYKTLGYFWHQEYMSMFVDEDLYWTCKNNNWIIFAEHLKFPHEHNCNGKAERDETYIRSEANWNQGKAKFAERKALNFPL